MAPETVAKSLSDPYTLVIEYVYDPYPSRGTGEPMARLTKAQFARLLGEAMDTLGIQGKWLAPAMGVTENTISFWLNPKKGKGPPHPEKRRDLERAMQVPEGYLDGDVDCDLEALRKARRKQAARLEWAGLNGGSQPGSAIRMVREQLAVYEGQRREVPTAIVRGWLDLLEGEARSSGLAAGASAIQAVELASGTGAAPAQAPRSGGKPPAPPGRKTG